MQDFFISFCAASNDKASDFHPNSSVNTPRENLDFLGSLGSVSSVMLFRKQVLATFTMSLRDQISVLLVFALMWEKNSFWTSSLVYSSEEIPTRYMLAPTPAATFSETPLASRNKTKSSLLLELRIWGVTLTKNALGKQPASLYILPHVSCKNSGSMSWCWRTRDTHWEEILTGLTGLTGSTGVTKGSVGSVDQRKDDSVSSSTILPSWYPW